MGYSAAMGYSDHAHEITLPMQYNM